MEIMENVYRIAVGSLLVSAGMLVGYVLGQHFFIPKQIAIIRYVPYPVEVIIREIYSAPCGD
jgi:hypothetical protein